MKTSSYLKWTLMWKRLEGDQTAVETCSYWKYIIPNAGGTSGQAAVKTSSCWKQWSQVA
ncbi:MAG: hypothetical protein ACR2JA_08960 [Hydrogenophaga sp.]|uniref:hypothetical protein n=1 Tax=Hydrogenophaga sp. TaxID=1904254 RepID=UPI003D9B4887